MNRKRIFITGATGFIGSHLVEDLLHNGYEVCCLVRNSSKARLLEKHDVEIVHGRLEEIDKWTGALRKCDSIIHLAAIRGEKFISWKTYYNVNVKSTERLLKEAIRLAIPKFIFFSTVGVFGTSPKQLPADENTVYNPDCNYHKSKMLAEQAILALSRREKADVKIVILRPTITYGPRDRGFLYSILRYATKGIFPIIGNGNNLIHLLHVKGLTQVVVKVLRSDQKRQVSFYNIADRKPIKYYALSLIIEDVLKRSLKIIRVPQLPVLLVAKLHDCVLAPLYHGKSMTISLKIASLPWYYSINKAIRELGYEPYDTISAVRETIRWYLENSAL